MINGASKKKFISIDSSTRKTGIGFFNRGKLVDYKLIDLSKEKDMETRLEQMCLAIIDEIKKYKPTAIAIEDSWQKTNVNTTKTLTRLMGVIYGYCILNSIQWESVLPSSWRRLCGIEQGKKKREELKQMSINYIKNKYDIEVNDDVADAICLGIAIINREGKS